ncbi:MAG: hypothetical protein AB7F43_06340 [Bacteriovoracia bacterium]
MSFQSVFLRKTLEFSLITCTILTQFHAESAFAFGSKRKETKKPAQPAQTVTQGYPTRVVSMGKMRPTPFLLPDGQTKVDAAIYMPDLVTTELSKKTTKLRSRGALSPDPVDCTTGKTVTGAFHDRFVLCGGISAFEANIFSAGVTIGYQPGIGDVGKGFDLSNAQLKGTLTIGQLEMDFHIYDTLKGQVVAVGKGDALMGRGTLNIEIDFTKIHSDWDFVYNSPMAPIFRDVIDQAVKAMVKDPKTNFYMDWESKVVEVNRDMGVLFMDTGLRDDIAVNNLFSVYDHNGFRIGEAKVTEVQNGKSILRMGNRSGNNGFAEDLRLINSVDMNDSVQIYYFTIPR